jgi:hypothetical protein
MAIETAARPVVAYGTIGEIEALVGGFESRTLPLARWSHQAHLTVGIWYLMRMTAAAATPLIRDGIKRYNASQGVPNSDTRGYHETITRFYIWSIGKFLDLAGPAGSLVDLTNRLIASEHGSKQYPFRYYSRDRLLSVAARHGWVEPDLMPLD